MNQSEEDGEGFPKVLPGFDVQSGIKKVGGNESFYRELLLCFIDEHNSSGEKLTDFLKNDDLEVAQFMAHSIKGTSGILAAMDLHAAAGDLEGAIARGQKDKLPALLGNCKKALDQVLESINTLKKPSQEEEPTS